MARRILALGVIALASAWSGCAGEQKDLPASAPMPPAESPPAPEPRRELSEVDALEHDLAVSERRLVAELERRGSEKSRAPAADSASKGAPPVPSRKKDAAGAEDVPEEQALESRSAQAGAPCDLACRAFASMQRAAKGICSITGPSDARCVSALERVKASADRIAQASCVCRPVP